MSGTTTDPTPIYCVKQTETRDGRLVWQVTKIGARRFLHSGVVYNDAVQKACALAKKANGILRLYKSNGLFNKEINYTK